MAKAYICDRCGQSQQGDTFARAPCSDAIEACVSSSTWIQTFTGRAFDLANPRPEDVCIEDIAHSLATLNRYTGHAAWPYSIAQHSIMVAEIVAATEPELGLAALLHDSPEAYTNDLSSPIKRMMRGPSEPFQVFLTVESSVTAAVCGHFGVWRGCFSGDSAARRLIKHADLVALATEKRDLFGPPPREGWGDATGFVLPEPLAVRCEEWPWREAKRRFLDAYERFGGER